MENKAANGRFMNLISSVLHASLGLPRIGNEASKTLSAQTCFVDLVQHFIATNFGLHKIESFRLLFSVFFHWVRPLGQAMFAHFENFTAAARSKLRMACHPYLNPKLILLHAAFHHSHRHIAA
jgi:hypothetical protein